MRATSRRAIPRAALIAAALLGSAALSGCYAHNPYGATSVSVSSGGYYGRPRANPYWGWRDNSYYPGVGVYVYDHDRRPHRWNNDQRRHWEDRGRDWDHNRGGDRRSRRGEWNDFRR